MRFKAAVSAASGVQVEEVELLGPGPHDVVVRVEAANVGIADTFTLPPDPFLGAPVRVVLGHAGVGVVERVGSAVERTRVGDRVLMTSTPNCGVCFYCQRGRPDQCASLGARGPAHVRLPDGTELPANSSVGCFAELAVVPETQVTTVTTELPGDQLSLIANPVATGVGAAFRTARVEPGSVAAVVGCGPVGLSYLQAAKLALAEQVIAVDPLSHRRKAAEQFGATAVVDPGEGDPVAAVCELAGDVGGTMQGRGADYVFEAAGPMVAVEQAWAMTRATGHVTLSGGCEPLDGTVTFPALPFVISGKSVHSCQQGSLLMRRDLPWLVRLAERGQLDVAGMAERSYALNEIGDALADVADRAVLGATVLPNG